MRAIHSALAQDVNLEIVIVDDGSAAPFAFSGDARVNLVRMPQNLGAAAARNAGVAAAQSGWLAFLDSDDVWTAGSLSARFKAARETNDADNVIWGATFTDVWPNGRRRTRRPIESSNALDFASGCWSCPGSTALLSRKAWDKSGGQDPALRRLEDYDWLLRWGAGGGRLAVHAAPAAEITRGGRASPEVIETASRHVRQKHENQSVPLRRRMESYLALEAAASAIQAQKPLAGMAALAKSWFLHPRFQAALEPFWTTPE